MKKHYYAYKANIGQEHYTFLVYFGNIKSHHQTKKDRILAG